MSSSSITLKAEQGEYLHRVDCKKSKPWNIKPYCIKILINFVRVEDMIWTKIRSYYILVFCHGRMSHSFLIIHSFTKKVKMTFMWQCKYGRLSLSQVIMLSAVHRISQQVFWNTCEKPIKQKEPLRGVPWKYLFLIFTNVEW